MRLPCGKFRGKEIEEIPSSYLMWIAENWSENTPQNKAICMAADEEYRDRTENDSHWYDDD